MEKDITRNDPLLTQEYAQVTRVDQLKLGQNVIVFLKNEQKSRKAEVTGLTANGQARLSVSGIPHDKYFESDFLVWAKAEARILKSGQRSQQSLGKIKQMGPKDLKQQPPNKDRNGKDLSIKRKRSVEYYCQHPGCPAKAVLLCGRCKIVSYCSVPCQREHWTVHQHSCQPAHGLLVGSSSIPEKQWKIQRVTSSDTKITPSDTKVTPVHSTAPRQGSQGSPLTYPNPQLNQQQLLLPSSSHSYSHFRSPSSDLEDVGLSQSLGSNFEPKFFDASSLAQQHPLNQQISSRDYSRSHERIQDEEDKGEILDQGSISQNAKQDENEENDEHELEREIVDDGDDEDGEEEEVESSTFLIA